MLASIYLSPCLYGVSKEGAKRQTSYHPKQLVAVDLFWTSGAKMSFMLIIIIIIGLNYLDHYLQVEMGQE